MTLNKKAQESARDALRANTIGMPPIMAMAVAGEVVEAYLDALNSTESAENGGKVSSDDGDVEPVAWRVRQPIDGGWGEWYVYDTKLYWSDECQYQGLMPIADHAQAIQSLQGEVERLRERERYFAEKLGVADGGQYRADWDAKLKGLLAAEARLKLAEEEIERLRRERDEALKLAYANGQDAADQMERAGAAEAKLALKEKE